MARNGLETNLQPVSCFPGLGGDSPQPAIGRACISLSPLEVFAGAPGFRVRTLPWIGRPDSFGLSPFTFDRSAGNLNPQP